MTAPAASPVDGGSTVLGKTVSELQTGISIQDNKITGTLLNVTDFAKFSGKKDLQKGHFLALNVSGAEGATLFHELIGAVDSPGLHQFKEGDKELIVRITNKETQKIRIVAQKKKYLPSEVTYELSGLTLQE